MTYSSRSDGPLRYAVTVAGPPEERHRAALPATLRIMLVAAAVCPCAPLLVPEVAAGAAPELDAARAACADALGVLAAAHPDRLVVVGPADEPGRGPHPEGTPG